MAFLTLNTVFEKSRKKVSKYLANKIKLHFFIFWKILSEFSKKYSKSDKFENGMILDDFQPLWFNSLLPKPYNFLLLCLPVRILFLAWRHFCTEIEKKRIIKSAIISYLSVTHFFASPKCISNASKRQRKIVTFFRGSLCVPSVASRQMLSWMAF